MPNRREVITHAAAAGALLATPRWAVAATTSLAPSNVLAPVLDRIANNIVAKNPEVATSLGLDRGDRAALSGQLSDVSAAAYARTRADMARYKSELASVDRRKLTGHDGIYYDTVMYALDSGLQGAKFSYGRADINGSRPYAVSQQDGAYQSVPEFLDSQHRVETRADVEAYLSRLNAFGTQLDQETARLNEDAARGVIAPSFLLATAMKQMTDLRATPAAQQRMVKSLARRVAANHLGADPSARATAIVETVVYPALDRQLAALRAIQPRATADAGVWKLPDGDRYYAWQLRSQTTTDLSPATVHATGLRQNAELEAEMDTLLRQQGLTQGSVGARMTALTADPKYLFPNTDAGRVDAVAYVQGCLAAIRPLLPKISKLGLRADIQVKRVPPDIQDGAALGYMNFAALDGSRPAIYYINLKDTGYWPRWTIPTLTAHEGVPGHAWQGAYLAEHRAELPLIASLLAFNAFVEGWALYAEQLVDENGLYANDPLGRLGYLQAQRFRAIRLVTDTGLHDKRWSREHAIDYMTGESGRARAAVASEVDRYCASPGQACGYKIGHNEIIRLRAKTKAALGAKYDQRDFNDALVRTGGVPLTVLDSVVDQHIAAMKAA